MKKSTLKVESKPIISAAIAIPSLLERKKILYVKGRGIFAGMGCGFFVNNQGSNTPTPKLNWGAKRRKMHRSGIFSKSDLGGFVGPLLGVI